jgi:flagellar biosynthesis protein FlhF
MNNAVCSAGEGAMQVKRYIAADMRQALKEIREDLGADAIILSNRPVKGGIEILATLDEKVSALFTAPPAPKVTAPAANSLHAENTAAPLADEELAASINPQRSAAADDAMDFGSVLKAVDERPVINIVNAPRSRGNQARFNANFENSDHFADPDSTDGISLKQELRTVRAMLEQQFNAFAWGEYRRQHPLKAAMLRKLQRLGIQSALGEELLENFDENLSQDQLWSSMMATLSDKLIAAPWDILEREGAYAFVGPTGAGKTTTIAKLAARYVMLHGHENLALISLDSYRIGSFEQLKVLGRILDVPVRFVTDVRGLGDALAQCRGKRMVMIDTAGLTRQHPQLSAQMQEISKLGNKVKTIQVHAATAQYAYMKNAALTYQTDNLIGCVLTKLDEASSLGECINLLAETKLPLLYTAHGQDIPNDIASGSGRELVKSAIQLAKTVATDELQVADQFADHMRRHAVR